MDAFAQVCATILGVTVICLSFQLSELRKAFLRKIRIYNANMASYGEVGKFNATAQVLGTAYYDEWKQDVYADEEAPIVEAYLSNPAYRQAVEEYRSRRGRLKLYIGLGLALLILTCFRLPIISSKDLN